jgi:hypothetical protein
MILVSLTAATICFGGSCYPALVGYTTPVGTYSLTLRLTEQKGYGGDVLEFTEDDTMWLAIHRLWKLNPEQKREERIHSRRIVDHFITKGCINIEPEVYEKLKNCCSAEPLVITR